MRFFTVAAGVCVAIAVVRVLVRQQRLRRESIDVGSVSEGWLADHRGRGGDRLS